MRSDGLKNLQISYNFLNLPSVVTQDDTPVAEYSWFADGSKYRVLTQQNNGYIYTGSLIYASNTGNLNYLDYGARMYDSNIGRWMVQDPLAEQLCGITPYRFSLNNPTNIIDIFGRSDYFDFNGQYLGSDGSVIYNSEIGMELSIAFSDANLDKDATLNIYNNYNITGLELIERKDDGNLNKAAGMTFTLRLCKQLNQIIPYIKIPINKNKDAKFIDNANNIINSFVHENEHLKDYKRLGLKGYQSMPEHEREQRAISKQVNHPSFINTTSQYKKAIYKYYQRMHQ
ncbi:MAG: hypothetical protein E7121_06330 [Bacteroidales bacterium]|nr:hypothetical protein [Bacteroidales bacterium]